MADLGEQLIASLLLGAEKDALADSPFAPISSAADLVGKTLIQASPHYGIGENILAGLLTGAVGGGADYLSHQYANNQNDLLQSVFANPTAGKPDGLSDSIFNKANAVRSIFKLENASDAQTAAAAARAKRNEFLFEETAKNPQKMKYNLGLMAGGDPNASQPMATPGNQTGPGGTLDYNDYLKRFNYDEGAAKTAYERDLTKPDRVADIEDKLRTQFLGQKAVQEFTDVSKTLAILQAAQNDPGSVSDLDYIYGVAHALDPASIVRESDAGQVIDSQAIAPATLGRLNKFLAGDAAIRAGGRQQFIDLVQRRYEIQKGIVDALGQQIGDVGKSRGADPAKIAILPQAAVVTAPAPGGVSQDDFQAMQTLAKSFPNTPEGRQQARAAWQMFQGQ